VLDGVYHEMVADSESHQNLAGPENLLAKLKAGCKKTVLEAQLQEK
jgi:hypothetical protein